MEDLEDLMIELDGADPATVHRIARERGSLPVRLSMLGLASSRKLRTPLWYGYPPGVFLSYKWAGEPMRRLVTGLARHLRGRGYRVHLDVETLDEGADAYFEIPAFITSLEDCTYYVLLLTELSGDLMTGRKGRTSWIFEEYQHAVRLVNAGRLVLVPVLLEPGGTTEFFSRDRVVDLTARPHEFERLDELLPPGPATLPQDEVAVLAAAMSSFDRTFLREDWAGADAVLRRTDAARHTFDHRLRRLLLALYTADEPRFLVEADELFTTYGQDLVLHLYSGYCAAHGIPRRMTARP